ncbi:MAG: hypothetical protein IKU48_04210 [Clostridia bacterium]|nr:hypothetical protein [Clostridia bacterium]
MTITKGFTLFNIFSFLTVFLFFFLLKSPVLASESVKIGISVCLTKAIPSLFPFLVLNELMLSWKIFDNLGIIFGTPFSKALKIKRHSFAAFLSGCLFGFPLGTKTAVSLYEKKLISKEEAENLICFCSNTGPAFIIGIVGTALCSKKIALAIYVSQIISALIIGLLLRKKGDYQQSPFFDTKTCFSLSDIPKAVTDSVMPILNICAFICFFSCISASFENILTAIGANEYISVFIIGLFEITKGISLLENYGTDFASIFCAAFILGWSGLSVILQSISITSKAGLGCKKFVISKALQGLICAIICIIICKIFKLY